MKPLRNRGFVIRQEHEKICMDVGAKVGRLGRESMASEGRHWHG
jgi:hypothetical protein